MFIEHKVWKGLQRTIQMQLSHFAHGKRRQIRVKIFAQHLIMSQYYR